MLAASAYSKPPPILLAVRSTLSEKACPWRSSTFEPPNQHPCRREFDHTVNAEGHQRQAAGGNSCGNRHRAFDEHPRDREPFEAKGALDQGGALRCRRRRPRLTAATSIAAASITSGFARSALVIAMAPPDRHARRREPPCRRSCASHASAGACIGSGGVRVCLHRLDGLRLIDARQARMRSGR